VANFRLEFINDVHARWLPVLSPKGSLCLPDEGITTADEYINKCGPMSLGGAARWIQASDELAASAPSDEVVRLILGDEFTGTPLFSSGKINEENSEVNRGYGAALHHYPFYFEETSANVKPTVLFVPGNHEFDMGLDVLRNYLQDSIALGTQVVCANCDFTATGCLYDKVNAPYNSGVTIDKSGIKLGVWGMTVLYLPEASICPKECRIKAHSEIIDEFITFYDNHDQIVIISHMGMDEDVRFADFLSKQMGTTDKIAGIFGSHTHSVICGEDGLDVDGIEGIIDHKLGNNGKTACETLGRFDEDVKTTLEESAYTSVTVEGANLDFPNYRELVSGGINIYHHAMHGLIHGSKVLKGSNDGSKTTFKNDQTQFKTLDSDKGLKKSVIEKQITDVNVMVGLSTDIVARSDTSLSAHCEGAAGCDGGYLLTMGNAGAGTKYLIPELKGFEDFKGGMVSLINGGQIRTDIPEGQISLLNIYSTYPFLNNLAGFMVSGANLWKNLLHGTIGYGEVQLFGARMVLGKDETVDTIKKKFEKDVTASGLPYDKYFCSDKYINKMSGRNKTYENIRRSGHELHSVTGTTYAESSEIADDGLTHTEYTGTGCHPVDPTVGYNFEINICAIEHFQSTREAGNKTEDFFPPPYYNDCACWEIIEPESSYMAMSVDFLLDGGDGYCLVDKENIRYDHHGLFDNEEVGTSGLVMDFIETYQSNVSGNKSFQLVNAEEETDDTTKSPETTKKSSSGLSVYAMGSTTVVLIAGLFF